MVFFCLKHYYLQVIRSFSNYLYNHNLFFAIIFYNFLSKIYIFFINLKTKG